MIDVSGNLIFREVTETTGDDTRTKPLNRRVRYVAAWLKEVAMRASSSGAKRLDRRDGANIAHFTFLTSAAVDGELVRKTWQYWDARCDRVRDAALHPDVATHDPHVLWSLIRYIEGPADRDDLAVELIDELLRGNDVPGDVRTQIEALKFTLSRENG